MTRDFILEEEIIEDIEEEIKAKKCDYCEGFGEVLADERINSMTIDIPIKNCPECGGTGIKEE